MEKRAFGRTGMEVSVLGFGGSEIRSVSAEEAGRVLNEALDAGLNVVDTAECYGDSEEKIGKTVSHRRDDYFLFTKCGHASGMDGEDWDPRMLERQIERSLKRLNTDRVDLVQLHTCGTDLLERGEVIEVLDRAKAAGKTRFIGYSGDNDAARWAAASGRFDTLQTSLNIADQGGIEGWVPLAQENGLGVIAKRPIANAAWLSEPGPDDYSRPYHDRLKELAYEGLTPSEALRFTLAIPGVHTAIVGTARPGRYRENARLLEEGPLPSDRYEYYRSHWRKQARADWDTKS